MKFKNIFFLEEKLCKPKEHIKNQRHHFANKVSYSQSYGFYSSHVRCESWTIKKAECQRIDAFELWCWRRLLSPLYSNGIKLVIPKGNLPWIFIGRTDAKAEAPVPWPADAKGPLTGKYSNAGRLRAGGEGGNREWNACMTSLTHGHEFEQTSGDGEGQGSLVCCSPWGHKELDMTEQLINTTKCTFSLF